MANRTLQKARQALGLSLEQLSDDVSISVSQLSRFESGARDPRASELLRLASRLNVEVASLLIEQEPRMVPVMGRVGAGAEIEPEFEQVGPDGLFEVEVCIPLPPGMIGFEIVGDSMYPRYDDGDVIVCAADGEPQAIIHGEEAAVRTSDGRRFLKRVMRDGDLFTLESHNAPPIRNVILEWASPVVVTVRRSRWRRLEKTTPGQPSKGRKKP